MTKEERNSFSLVLDNGKVLNLFSEYSNDPDSQSCSLNFNIGEEIMTKPKIAKTQKLVTVEPAEKQAALNGLDCVINYLSKHAEFSEHDVLSMKMIYHRIEVALDDGPTDGSDSRLDSDIENREEESVEDITETCENSLICAEVPAPQIPDVPKKANAGSRVKLKRLSRKSYQCEQCNMKFAKQAIFHAHKRMHAGLLPYECKVCGNTFKTSTGLRNHQLIHTDVEFQCEQCGKVFKKPGHLYTHRLTHFPKKFACFICGKRSTTSSANLSHMRTHSGEKHECQFCGKVFGNYARFRNHKNKKHALKVEFSAV